MQPAEAACSTLEAFPPFGTSFPASFFSFGAAVCYTGINSQKVSTKHGNFNQSQTPNAWMGQVPQNASTGSHTPSWQLDDT